MAKKKNWVYTEAPGCKVGLMKCCGCNKKITSGEYRYYETEHAYVPQCKSCGGGDTHWVEHDRQNAEAIRKQWEADANTECSVLLQRIKDAFVEGWHSYATPASAYNSPEEAWEESEAKRIHDTLKELWSKQ